MTKFMTVGLGVYNLAEASRLTNVPRHYIRRWTVGYTYKLHDKPQFMPPIIGREHVGGDVLLTFADLIEIRFLNHFRKHGVSSQALRIASYRAQEFLGRPRPFSTQMFKTDGITILAEITKGTEDKVLLDLVKSQYAFNKVISPYLFKGLEFNVLKEPKRWWPMGEERSVVIDPQRSFGAPIVVRSGVPTKILARAMKSESSIKLVARWFEVEEQEVTDAAEYESQLAA